MIKKILIVGNNASWALETYYNKYLNQLGFESTIFNVPNFVQITSIVQRIRNRIGDTTIYKNVNKEIIKYCSIHKPDIVWVFKGVEFYVETLETLKNNGHFLVNYNPDHPFIRTSITHGGKNIPNAIPIYNLHFSYRNDLVQQLQNEYGVKTVRLPFGYEISENNFNIAQQQKEVNKVCFVGTPDIERAKQLNELANNGFKIDIYSLTYQKKQLLNKNKNIETYPVVLQQDFWNTLRKYRVQINFLRKHNIGSHNQRTFEVPGIGGILLTPFSDEQNVFFENKKQIFSFNSNEEACTIMNYLLSLNSKNINEIREEARLHSIQYKYSYKDRAEIVAQTFNKII